MVILKNCELSYTLAELFNMCLKESCFPDFWKRSLVVHVFKNVRETSTAKNYCPIYPRLLTEFGMLVFFTIVSLIEFEVRYLAIFFLFSVKTPLGGSG